MYLYNISYHRIILDYFYLIPLGFFGKQLFCNSVVVHKQISWRTYLWKLSVSPGRRVCVFFYLLWCSAVFKRWEYILRKVYHDLKYSVNFQLIPALKYLHAGRFFSALRSCDLTTAAQSSVRCVTPQVCLMCSESHAVKHHSKLMLM